jgi:ankyrin repeat protein
VVTKTGAGVMHEAVSHSSDPSQDSARIKFLQSKGVSINDADATGMTPLHNAIFGDAMLSAIFGKMPFAQDKKSMTDMLLALGANPNSANKKGWTPLHFAAFLNQAQVVKALLTKKCDVNTRTVDGMTPLHLACYKGLVEKHELGTLCAFLIPEEILTELQESDRLEMSAGFSELFGLLADATVVDILVKAKADVRAKDSTGRTPMGIALYSGFSEAQLILLKAGAPAEKAGKVAPPRTGNYAKALSFPPTIIPGNTPLHRAAAKGQLEVVRSLLAKGAAVNARNDGGQTPLHLACLDAKTSSPEVPDLLLLQGAEVNAVDEAGNTPLHEAAQAGRPELVGKLLAQRADVTVQNHDGRTPLHLAANAEVAALLVKAGAKLEARDECGRTPLATAVLSGTAAVVEALLASGADVRVVDEKGGTLLHSAAFSQADKIGEVIRLLRGRGLDINAKDALGRH